MSESMDPRPGPAGQSPDDLAARVKELEARLRALEGWARSVSASSGQAEGPRQTGSASNLFADDNIAFDPVGFPPPPPPPPFYRQLYGLVRYVERLRAGYGARRDKGPRG